MHTDRFEQLFHAAQRHFEGWGVTAQDRVVLVADNGTHRPLLDACHAAAVAAGADVTMVMYNARRKPFMDIPRAAEAAILESTFYLILMSGRWSYSASMDRVLNHPRHKQIRTSEWDGDPDSVNHFVELIPNQEVIDRTMRAQVLIDNAKQIRITSDLGTDIVMERGDPAHIPTYIEYGQVAIAAPYQSVNGTIVFKGAHRSRFPGPLGHRRLTQWPVRMTFEHGYITHIARDNPDGEFLDDWFRQWNDREVYRFAHINLGLEHRIRLEYLDNLAVHFNYGGLLFGVGAMNTPLFGHGDVYQAKAHIELQLTGADYYLDGRQILSHGEFLPDTGLGRPADVT